MDELLRIVSRSGAVFIFSKLKREGKLNC
jgi:hypothetical protein